VRQRFLFLRWITQSRMRYAATTAKSRVTERTTSKKISPKSAHWQAICQGRQSSDNLACGRMDSVAVIAGRERVLTNYVRRLTRFAFLTLRIVEAIAGAPAHTRGACADCGYWW
jgi:hypothetical protein